MAMSYTSLIADKGTSGSIANWVNYSRLDLPVIVDEAQALIYQYLRVREMKSAFAFAMPIGLSEAVVLPTGFLDPIGRMMSTTTNDEFSLRSEGEILQGRSYSPITGSLGADPFTFTAGATSMTVALPNNGLSQGSTISFDGANTIGGVNPNASFAVAWTIRSILNPNSFVVDGAAIDGFSSSGTGGGSAVTFSCDNLQQGTPKIWGVWDEKIHFDRAFSQQTICKLLYYRSLPLLSSSNTTNFLTSRYPNLMRTASQAAAADYMKDDPEYTKGVQRLQMLIGRIQQADDLQYRGADIYTETPYGG